MIKSLLLSLVVFLPILFSTSASLVFADNSSSINVGSACQQVGQAGSSSAFCQDTSTAPISGADSVGNKVVNLIAAVAGFAAVVVIIISGIQFITSSGDPQKVNKAKNSILYASIGLVIVALARIIIFFIVGSF